MTVTSETSRASYNGDGSTVVFTVPFYFLEDSSIAVTLVASDETETTQVLNTDYTVTDAGELTGGSITMATAPAVGEMLVIIRDESLTQTTDYIENDAFPAESHERALDKAMMINQQQQEELARCITAPVGDDGTTDYTLPTYEASSYMQWNPSAKELRNAELTATGTATIGTDAGDLVELVEVASGSIGFPALALDNMTYSGSAVTSVVTKSTGTASGAIPLNSDLGSASLVDTGTASGTVVLNENIGTAAEEDIGTTSGTVATLSSGGTFAEARIPYLNSSIIKGWVNFTGATPPVISDSYNVSSVTRTSAGIFIVNWDTDFADTGYSVVANASSQLIASIETIATGSCTIYTQTTGGTLSDPTQVTVMAIGAQ